MWEQRLSTQYDAVRMQLYGLYKVAKEGKCQEPKPKPDTVGRECSPADNTRERTSKRPAAHRPKSATLPRKRYLVIMTTTTVIKCVL